MSTYIIYARKSTESEDKQILSIESQISELKKLAAQKGIQIAEIYTESKTAKEPGRPVFNKIMNLVQKKGIKGILCWKIDRLARNPVDEATVRWAIKTKDLEVITPFQIYSLKQDNSILSSIEFAMAEK